MTSLPTDLIMFSVLILQYHYHDFFQELLSQMSNGEAKVKATTDLGGLTLKSTSAPGCELLRRNMDSLQGDWSYIQTKMADTKVTLELAVSQWKEFEEKYEALSQWLKSQEQQLRECELKATSQEKQQQVDALKVSAGKTQGNTLNTFVYGYY